MAVAVDASSPIRFTGLWHARDGGSITSAAFTAPDDSLLVLCGEADTNATSATGLLSASDTGGLVWTKRVERTGLESTAGATSAISTARTTSAVSRTVSLVGGASGADGGWGTGRASAKLYVLTGVDVDGTPVDSVTASNEGGSATNQITTTSITPGANGLLVVASCDWTAGGGAAYEAPSDGSTQDTATYAGAMSAVDGYKTATSGVALGMDLNAGGAAAAQHKWCQILVRVSPIVVKFTFDHNQRLRPAAFRPGLAR